MNDFFPPPSALYVHVPFCPVICPYCDFHKMRRNEELVAAYLQRIEREATDLAARYPGPMASIYFGGGTPSHLTDEELGRLIGAVEAGWGWPATVETTIEADPLTFDASRARRLRDVGFNRLSIGLQSTQDGVLRFLGRGHTGAAGLRAVDDALGAGLAVTVDLMAAVPGQNLGVDLEAVVASGVGHVSVYSLTVEPHTPFAFAGVRTDPDHDADDFDLTQRTLHAAGLNRYEVSNHARPGRESVHNQTYWRGDYYLALGPGATSFLPDGAPEAVGTRRTAPTIKAWLTEPADGVDVGEASLVDAERWVEDVLMTGLRTALGVDIAEVSRRSGLDVRSKYGERIATLVEQGMLLEGGGRLVATDEGLRRLNAVLAELLWA